MASPDRKKVLDEILGPKDQAEKSDSKGMGALQAISEELIDAVHAKDAAGVESALRAAFAELDQDDCSDEDEA